MEDSRDLRIAELEAENAELWQRLAQREHQLQAFLQRRKRAKPRGTPRQGTPADRRRQEHRNHGDAFAATRQSLGDRFDDLLLNSRSRHPECRRIWKRLFKHGDELFTFLNDPRVPAGNNGSERDIRSLAAARNDGGTHRAEWSATAFARIKCVIVTSLKNGVRFIHYGREVVRAPLQGQSLPLPLPDPT